MKKYIILFMIWAAVAAGQNATDVGNAWGHGSLRVGVGTVITAGITSDKDDTHASWFDFKFKGTRIDD